MRDPLGVCTHGSLGRDESSFQGNFVLRWGGGVDPWILSPLPVVLHHLVLTLLSSLSQLLQQGTTTGQLGHSSLKEGYLGAFQYRCRTPLSTAEGG